MRKLILLVLLVSMIFPSLYAQNDLENSRANEVTQKSNLTIVSSYFNCLFKTQDFKTLSQIIAKEAVYQQAEGLLYGGIYKGFDQWMKMFTKAASYFDLKIETEPIYYTNTQNNNISISFTIRCKSKASNNEFTMPISEYFELKDGLITAVRPFYYDTKLFSEMINPAIELKIPKVIDTYVNAWSEANTLKRLAQIQSIWAENGTYHDAVAKIKGPSELNNMIEKFRADFPNSIFKTNNVLSFDNTHTWSWTIVNKEKNFILDGRDYIELDGDGKIVKLIGFWGKEK